MSRRSESAVTSGGSPPSEKSHEEDQQSIIRALERHQTRSSSQEYDSTRATKVKQVDRLTRVKQLTMAIVIITDIIMAVALASQIILLSLALSRTLATRVSNTNGFVGFQYANLFTSMESSPIHLSNSSISMACSALNTDPNALSEIHHRFRSEQTHRRLEFVAMLNANAIVISSGSAASIGRLFDPASLISKYGSQYRLSRKTMTASVLVNREAFELMDAPVYMEIGADAGSTWKMKPETLVLFTIVPIWCMDAQDISGFFVYGLAITSARPSTFSKVLEVRPGGAFVGVVSRTMGGNWSTSYSYDSSTSKAEAFPDLASLISHDDLNRALTQRSGIMGTVEISESAFTFSAERAPEATVGGSVIDQTIPIPALYMYGEKKGIVRSTVLKAFFCHAPVFLILVASSFFFLRYAWIKFLEPMQRLIESVQKKRVNEFNDSMREMHNNQSLLMVIVGKTLLIQAMLIGLIFINRNLLMTVFREFTAATSEAKLMSTIFNSKPHAVKDYMVGWASFSVVISAVETGTFSPEFVSDLQLAARYLEIDSISVVNMRGIIEASSYAPSIGNPVSDVAFVDYLDHMGATETKEFTTTEVWTQKLIWDYTGKNISFTNETPGVVRITGAGIHERKEEHEQEHEHSQKGIKGAFIAIDVLNNKESFWDRILSAFGHGYFGKYIWHNHAKRFELISSAFQEDNGKIKNGVELTGESRMVLKEGMSTVYTDTLFFKTNVNIEGEKYSVSVASLRQSDEVKFNEYVLNAYNVRGLPEAQWRAMLRNQLLVQLLIACIQLFMTTIKITLTYVPMRKFLSSLDGAFNIPSISQREREQRDHRTERLLGTFVSQDRTKTTGAV